MFKFTPQAVKSAVVAATLAMSAFSMQAQAVSLTYSSSSGVLTGANGVTVNGKSYNVSFVDGLYSDNVTSVFASSTEATAAMQALSDQVFSTPDLDELIIKPFGCSYEYQCNIETIYKVETIGKNTSYYAAYFTNNLTGATDYVDSYDTETDWNNADQTAYNIAVWTQASTVSAVPVPAAAWLFGSGLLGMMGLRRRKQVV